MSEFRLRDMSPMQFDVLKEVGNIGTGNAATAISKMVGHKVDMCVPEVSLCSFDELANIVGGPEEVMTAILIGLQEDLTGMMMFLFDGASAGHLVEAMMGTKREPDDPFDDIELSAINEVGNIISGAYLTALSTFMNLTITSTVPVLSVDMAGALLDIPAAEFGKVGEEVLLIKTKFDEANDIKGFFLLIPDIESYQKMLSTFGF